MENEVEDTNRRNKLLHPNFRIICIYTGDILEEDIPQEDLQNAIFRAIEAQKSRSLYKDKSNFTVRIM